MADSQKEAIKLMADEVVRAIRKITDENNRNYVNAQISNSKSAPVISGAIYPSQIVGLYPTVSGYIANAPAQAEQGDPYAASIVLAVNGLADIQIQHATIDTAQIDELDAYTANFVHMAAQNVQIGDIDMEVLRGDFADLGLLKVNQANIGYAQIKDLTTGTALIRKGSAGEFYIDDLKVAVAQIAGLEVGELIIESSVDHKLYRVDIDGQGQITVTPRPINGGVNGDIGAGTIVGASIANSTITNGLIANSTIEPEKINIPNFFASEAVIGTLETTLITSQTFGEDLDISSNPSIVLTSDQIELILDYDPTHPQKIQFTSGMATAIFDTINLEADNLNLSGNSTVQISSAGQISASARQNMDLSANETIEIKSGTQISATAYEGIVNTVVGSSAISQISQTADRINYVITQGSTSSSITMTPAAMSAISDQITLTADKINAVANDIELTGNESVYIHSDTQISANALQSMDLSANDTVRITSGNQISVSAIQDIDLTANQVVMGLTGTEDNIKNWITFGDSMKVQKEGSDWYTETAGTGFYVKNTQIAEAIAAFEGLATKVQSLMVGNGAQIKIVNDGSGGMAWVDV